MDKVVFVTATWARTPEEESRIKKTLSCLANYKYPIVIGNKSNTPISLEDFINSLPRTTVIKGNNLHKQRVNAYKKAKELGKNVFWLESDKKEFVKNHIEELLGLIDEEEKLVIPGLTGKSFSNYPEFQILVENAINNIIGNLIGIKGHYTYGPMIFPAGLIDYLNKTDKEFGWGINAFLLMLGYSEDMEIKQVEIDIKHDSDIQNGDEVKIFRIEQLKEYLTAFQEALKIINSNNQ